MSASGTIEKLRTAEGVMEVANAFLGVSLSRSQASRCTANPGEKPQGPSVGRVGWMHDPESVSVGAIVSLKIAIMRLPNSPLLSSPREDDGVPIVMVKRGRKKCATICPVARSEMFTTIQIVEPIDLVGLIVAGTARKPE